MWKITMKHFGIFCLLTAVFLPAALAQPRDWRVHQRGMLHQTVFNTGELGRTYNAGGTIDEGFPSMEYPPNSRMIIDRTNYPGQHNSFGSGLWVAGTRPGGRQYMYCGAVAGTTDGDPTTVSGVYSNPISIELRENTPLLANGNLNPAYDPDEAEETIVAKWGTPLGITVTRTSRVWSFPGYDSFIIYEYELQNTTPDTISDVHVVFASTFCPSMFGYLRNYGTWTEANYRGQPPNGKGDQFTRFDLRRWMTYNHDREGVPDTLYFDIWSTPGNRGGLNSPQAVGLVMLRYDYDHLSLRNQTGQVWIQSSDSAGMWDQNNKAKQPFLLRYENGGLYTSKIETWLNPALVRKTGTFQGSADSARFYQFDPVNAVQAWSYWKGRTKGSVNLSWWQPVSHAYGFFPYLLPPNESLRFSVAEVAGYGPGVAGDRIYNDLGGAVRAGVDAGAYFNPVPSWYDTLQYPYLGAKPYIGSRYLQSHPLPWYVTPGVVSIRDVADRAIEMYTGQPLMKHDTLQYEPLNAPSTGAYSSIPIPVPSPIIAVRNTPLGKNQISWGPQVEAFTTPRLRAAFKHYELLRAQDPLGPWTVLDTVVSRDQRYYSDSAGAYLFMDLSSLLGGNYYYAVVSVDSLGGKSGMLTNFTPHQTDIGPVTTLGKVYVIPNPLVVTNGLSGQSDPNGEVTDRVQFFGLTKHCTIRIFSYSGQLVNTIEHNAESYYNSWYQISRNDQLLASGVYFFVVEDENGARSHGKFVVIH
jgi:hypothetical protein